MNLKVAGVLAALTFVAILFTIASRSNPKDALDAMSRIKRGMTYAEIAKIVPLNDTHRLSARENGGVLYDVPIDSKHLIQLRFEHPTDNTTVQDTKINYSPRLRDRNTLTFIAGDEQPWPTDDLNTQ